jgi:hypothetical protein
MKRAVLLLGAGLLLWLTGLTLAHAGWLPYTGESADTSADQAGEDDSLTSDAVLRYKSGQPRHWRACVIPQH